MLISGLTMDFSGFSGGNLSTICLDWLDRDPPSEAGVTSVGTATADLGTGIGVTLGNIGAAAMGAEAIGAVVVAFKDDSGGKGNGSFCAIISALPAAGESEGRSRGAADATTTG